MTASSERQVIYCYNLEEFKKAIKQRKTDLGYKKESDVYYSSCSNCKFFYDIGMYMHRCHLISYEIDQRCASIRLSGICNMHLGYDSKKKCSFEDEAKDKYPFIELKVY